MVQVAGRHLPREHEAQPRGPVTAFGERLAGPNGSHRSARDDRANARHTRQPFASSVLPGQDGNLIG